MMIIMMSSPLPYIPQFIIIVELGLYQVQNTLKHKCPHHALHDSVIKLCPHNFFPGIYQVQNFSKLYESFMFTKLIIRV